MHVVFGILNIDIFMMVMDKRALDVRVTAAIDCGDCGYDFESPGLGPPVAPRAPCTPGSSGCSSPPTATNGSSPATVKPKKGNFDFTFLVFQSLLWFFLLTMSFERIREPDKMSASLTPKNDKNMDIVSCGYCIMWILYLKHERMVIILFAIILIWGKISAKN